MSERSLPKVAPYILPERYDLPARPARASPAVQDAHRQTQFLLSSDLALFEGAMNLQLAAVAASARRRSPEAAALLGFWSRTYSYLADSCVLLSRGAYVSCPPLLRAACDCVAAQRSLLTDGFDEYLDWLAPALGKDQQHAASHVDLGRFRAGSALAGDQRLGSVYRFLTDLTMPHFGSTILEVAPDSTQQKLALTFAGNAFHLGWAELTAGWLLLVANAQLQTALSADVLGADDARREEAARLDRQVEKALANPRRCHAEELPGGQRLIHNFRRAVSGGPKRVLF